MSNDEFTRLVDDVKSNDALKAEFAVVRDTPEKWVSLANEKGYNITLERAKALEELSDNDLEQVAGGGDNVFINIY